MDTSKGGIAKIVYMDKRTLVEQEISFKYVSDNKHAMQVAKKLRPKYHKLVRVTVIYPFEAK